MNEDAFEALQRRLLKGLATLAIGALALCTVSRAPTLLDGFTVQGLKLLLNVGYVVTFGIPLLVLAEYGVWVGMARLGKLGMQRVGGGEADERSGTPRLHWPVLLFFPAVASLFLWRQLVFEFAERGPASDLLANCNTFDHLRMFYDFALFDGDFVYCFSGLDEQQLRLPDLYPPLQTWLYLGFCVLGFWMAWRCFAIWRRLPAS